MQNRKYKHTTATVFAYCNFFLFIFFCFSVYVETAKTNLQKNYENILTSRNRSNCRIDEFIRIFMEFNEVITTNLSPDIVFICKKTPILGYHDVNMHLDEPYKTITEHYLSGAVFEVLNLTSLV